MFKGAYGEHQYKVEVARPTDVETKDLAAWAQADLAKINQAGAPRVEAPIKNLPALKVTNLKLPGLSEGACPAVRVYARTDRLTGGQDYLAMTVTQADKSPCDETNAKRLADALITEVGT